MLFRPHSAQLNGIIICSPLIAIFILWSEIRYKTKESKNRYDCFLWDFFIISYSFIIGTLLSLCFQLRITEAVDLWPLYLYFMAALGIAFSIIFSFSALLLVPHSNYTKIMGIIITLIILIFNLLSNIFPRHVDGYLLFALLGITLSSHLLFCLFYRINKKFHCI